MNRDIKDFDPNVFLNAAEGLDEEQNDVVDEEQQRAEDFVRNQFLKIRDEALKEAEQKDTIQRQPVEESLPSPTSIQPESQPSQYKDIKDFDPNVFLKAAEGAEEAKPTEQQQIPEEDGLVRSVQDFLISGAQGALFDFGDELLAAVEAVSKGDPSKYRELQQKHEKEMKQIEERSPILSTIGSLVGGFMVPGLGVAGTLKKASTLGQKLVPAAKAGAIYGGLSSLGSSEKYIDPNKPLESIYELGKESVEGGAYGAGAGLALGVAGKGINKIGQLIEESKLKKPWLKIRDTAERMFKNDTMEVEDPITKTIRIEPLDITTRQGSEAVTKQVANVTEKLKNAILVPFNLAKKEYGRTIDKLSGMKITPFVEEEGVKTRSFLFDQINKLLRKNKDIIKQIDTDILDKFIINDEKIFKKIISKNKNFTKEMYEAALEMRKKYRKQGFLKNKDVPEFFKSEEGKKAYDLFANIYKSNLPKGGTLKDLYNLRQGIMGERSKTTYNADQVKRMYGFNYNKETGEKEGKGIIDIIDDILDEVDPRIKTNRQKIKDAARIPESIINRNLSETAQPKKMYDMDEESINKNLLDKIENKIQVAELATTEANKERIFLKEILNNFRNEYNKNPKLSAQFDSPGAFVDKLENEIFDISEKSAANLSLNPQYAGQRVPNLSTYTNGLRRVSFAEAGLAKEKIKKEVGEIVEKTPLLKGAAKVAGAAGRATTFPARTAADALKKSANPRMQQLGAYLEESLQNKSGAASAAALNTIFQNSKSREELGLEPGETISDIEDK